MSPRGATIAAVAAAVLFSTGGAAIKTGAFTAAQVSAARSGIAAFALMVWLAGNVTWSLRAFWIGAVYAATLTLFVASTKLTTSANAIFLQSTAPLYILILSPALIGERFRKWDLMYALAVGTGLLFCFVGRAPATALAPNPILGNVLGIVCSVAWAGTLMALRAAQRGSVPRGPTDIGLSAVVAGNLIACVVALPFAWPFPHASPVEWGTLVYLGVFQIGLAYMCLTTAIRELPALEVSLLLLLEPVLNPVWTWLVRGEEPGIRVIVGGVFIVAATAAKSVYDTRTVVS